jgi:hypothetical protein
MQLRMGDVTQGKKHQPSADDWKSHTEYALDIAYAVLGRLDCALLVEDVMRKRIVPTRIISTSWLNIAIEEIKTYCAAGGTGFAD